MRTVGDSRRDSIGRKKNKKQRTNRSINQIRRPIIYIVSVCHQPGKAMFSLSNGLEAFAVDDSGASLVVLLLGDPHLLEGGERTQDGATDPDRVFSLGRSDDLDLHGGRSHGGDLLLHTISDTGVHGGATGEDGVGVEILTDINVALHDGVEGS